MKRLAPISILALILAAAWPFAVASAAPVKRSLCVYDPSGESGDLYKTVVPYALAALEWGVDFGHPQVRQDEKIAAEDFRAGKCDAVILTGVRARQFVPFAGTVEAMGAVQSYKQLKAVVGALARPSESKLMKNGGFESVGILPAGAVYLHVRDRNLKDITSLAGKRIATLDFDAAANLMVGRVGAAAVSADISTFSGMFNSGSVDVAYAPATAFKPLELGKGIGANGGVLRFPLAQLTFQVLIHSDKAPETFGDASRKYTAGQFDTMMKIVGRAEKDVPAKAWIEVPDPRSYDAMFQGVRIELRNKNVYDRTMLHKLLLMRCHDDSGRAECAEKKE
jgi:hypothetical protein